MVWEGPLEKEMAIHYITFAWKTLWTEEPARQQAMGLQRVGHDLATGQQLTILRTALKKERKKSTNYDFGINQESWSGINGIEILQ